jgi:hypothetical protein
MTQKNQIINYVDDGKLCKINLPENSIALIVPDDFSIIFEGFDTNEECHFNPIKIHHEMLLALDAMSDKLDKSFKQIIFKSVQITCEMMQEISNKMLLDEELNDEEYASMFVLSSIEDYEAFILRVAKIYMSANAH